MSKGLRTPMDIAHAYGFSLQGLITLVSELRCADGLPESQDIDLSLLAHRLSGKSMAQIGREWHISPERVRKRTIRALNRCRQVRYDRMKAGLPKPKEESI